MAPLVTLGAWGDSLETDFYLHSVTILDNMRGVEPLIERAVEPLERESEDRREHTGNLTETQPVDQFWTRFIRTQDVVWFLLFAALAAFGPEQTGVAISILTCLAVFQMVESRIPFLGTEGGNVFSIAVKLVLAWVLIVYTGKIQSGYYFILLLPVVSAATSLGLLGTTVFIVLACAAYLSFLLFVDWTNFYIPGGEIKQLLLRVALLPVVGFLTQQLAETNRMRARSYRTVAEQLADANRNLRAAEAAVRRSDRLAALGQLTAGLAHELRNPLSTIKTSAEMLGKTVPEDNAVAKEVAGYISTEVDRTNSLITRFLEFARPVKLRLDAVDVTTVIDQAISQVERHSPPLPVSIYRNYSPDAPPILLDAELMERVFYNLLLNAAQASPAQGAITVKTRAAGDSIEVSIIDRGSGIDPKHLENIFNPFFTTKPEGVGLGLAIVSKIVDEHHGKIVVESHPGEGSIFRVYLPVGRKSE
jgi:signal transduction histidine kinase